MQLGVFVEWEDEVAGIDAAVGVESREESRLWKLIAPSGYQHGGDFSLGEAVGRKSSSDRSDLH